MSRIDEINEKVSNLIKFAEEMYGSKLPNIEVRYDLRGRSAGQAIRRNMSYSMRFNIDMINNDGFDHIINETVPHELAHIICMYTGTDKGHGKVWKSICIMLGGNGQRCHNEEVIPARITQKFTYKATCGTTIKVSKVRHNKIQKGSLYILKNTGGKINSHCFVA